MDQSRRWYRILLVLVSFWCAAIVAAPLARVAGAPAEVSATFYAMFSHVCHQFADRSFQLVGEPFGVCMRCTAIYAGFLGMLALFPFVRGIGNTELPPRWILVASLTPMALDVALNLLGLHASSVMTRVVSGSVAGIALPLFIVPPLLEALNKLLPSGESFDARQAQ